MHCTWVKLPNSQAALVCTSGGRSYRERAHRCACRQIARLQCDWKLAAGKTCDAWICDACAHEGGPNKHLCPEHQRTYKEWLAQREPVESRITVLMANTAPRQDPEFLSDLAAKLAALLMEEGLPRQMMRRLRRQAPGRRWRSRASSWTSPGLLRLSMRRARYAPLPIVRRVAGRLPRSRRIFETA
jgi:hypothetical protein